MLWSSSCLKKTTMFLLSIIKVLVFMLRELVLRKEHTFPTPGFSEEGFFLSTYGFLAQPLLFTMDIEWVTWLDKSGRGIGHLQLSIFLSSSSSGSQPGSSLPGVLQGKPHRGQPSEEQFCLGLVHLPLSSVISIKLSMSSFAIHLSFF